MTPTPDPPRPAPGPGERHAPRLLELLRSRSDELSGLLAALARAESPTDHPEMQGSVRELLTREWEANGYRVRTVAGRRYGSRLLAAPRDRRRGHPRQLLVGHLDTVWPPDTTRTMPVELRHGRLHGPGTFDMKAGLVLMIHAVRALRDLELTAPADPVAFVVADEEVGSPESRRDTERLARVSQRAFVLEPPMGEDGALKTARKGVARFTVHIQGRASHAGLAPEEGVSAVAELADVVQALHGLTDPARGVSVNVGVVEGGTRPNVVAAEATARVDVRVLTRRDGERVMAAIRGLAPSRPGIRLTVEGGMQHGPLEPTPANRRLWQRARSLADALGFSLRETTAGGASDGNLTSMHTPTLDGLGAVGDGAHAVHEHVLVDSLPRRAALLAGLLLSPLPPGDAG